MHDIFVPETNRQLQYRLQRLTAGAKPIWGRMNAAQMLLHCQKPLEVATGKLRLRHSLIGILFGKMAKRNFLQSDEFRKNLPTAPQFKIIETPDFEVEKSNLQRLVAQFGEMGPSIIANETHPFFGKMTLEEWGILQYKHLDHHLKQFGV